ncbi:aromatic-ring-hydroxylating dioxygenase subunit beta [Novosphingobium sp. UBA1939]|uniref:aromatic-ring-hydroxylating dioxygenase subunit beta n=1 Tax=Novosphingobium sp. UBA1939 TaxID=1946982 RepID=UPI0025F9C3A0|nr:aromatic-ring-hydroxylating dioxygenase subunit beta [Novosphingobium sp. UBA1939]
MSTSATTATLTATAAIGLDEAAAFIWAEGELLDRLAYKDWLPLWAGGHYVIPIDRDASDPVDALNIAYDDATMREARVKRLLSGFSMSSAPPARTVRSASRFVVEDSAPGALTVRCAQILVEYKYGRTRTLAADVTYRLVRTDAGLRMAGKTILLLNSDEDLFGIGYLL